MLKKFILLLSASGTLQASPAFDVSSIESVLSTGIAACVSVAMLVAALFAGVLAWRKIAEYFEKVDNESDQSRNTDEIFGGGDNEFDDDSEVYESSVYEHGYDVTNDGDHHVPF